MAAHDKSARRDLDEQHYRDITVKTADVASWSRQELEAEVLRLHKLQAANQLNAAHDASGLREVVSHLSTGTDVSDASARPNLVKTTGQEEQATAQLAAKDAPHLEKHADSPTAVHENMPMGEVLKKAGARALGGGLPGACAMVVQVGGLMWLRTTMNYQYRHGTSTREAFRALYKQGGIMRFYQGAGPALIQGPLARFGDTAANAGMLALLDNSESTRSLPTGVKTIASSAAAAAWRINLMPVDTIKTCMQVEGSAGLSMLKAKVQKGGIRVFYSGALAASTATFAGHYPWFATHNLLSANLPPADGLWQKLTRNATIGFCSSFVSDCCSNSIRVVKVSKQSSPVPITYMETVKEIIAADGLQGLFLRGLGTRVLANGTQGMLFVIAWKGLEEKWAEQRAEQSPSANRHATAAVS